MEWVKKRVTKMSRGMEHLSCEERKGLVVTIAASQYLKEAYGKNGEKLFTRACGYRTRGNGFKLK